MLRIAHRGTPHFAPENSLEGFERALAYRPDFVELDVRKSKDGHLVLMHDKTVERTTDGRGKVAKMTLEKLRECRLANGEPVPTLAEALDLLKDKVKLKVDVKAPGLERDVVKELRRVGMLRRTMVIAYGKKSLLAFKKASAKLRTEVGAASFRPRRGAYIKLALRTGAEALSVRHNIISHAFVNACHAKGLEVHAWTVNDVRLAQRLAEMGVDAVATNRLDLL